MTPNLYRYTHSTKFGSHHAKIWKYHCARRGESLRLQSTGRKTLCNFKRNFLCARHSRSSGLPPSVHSTCPSSPSSSSQQELYAASCRPSLYQVNGEHPALHLSISIPRPQSSRQNGRSISNRIEYGHLLFRTEAKEERQSSNELQ